MIRTLRQNATDLAHGKLAEEVSAVVRLPKGKGRGGAGNLQLSTTVLGRNLGLEGPPVLWVCVQSLQKREGKSNRVKDSAMNGFDLGKIVLLMAEIMSYKVADNDAARFV